MVVVNRLVEVWSGIGIAPQTRVGPGLYIGHFGGVIISGDVVIGANCNLSQGVTLGVGGRGASRGCPVLGDRVYVGPGAKVFGPISIGDDAAIGANAVVTGDVPPGAVVAGVPARVLNYSGSFDFVSYPGMETDPSRACALSARRRDQTV
jgi:serine O-acetyltransferase